MGAGVSAHGNRRFYHAPEGQKLYQTRQNGLYLSVVSVRVLSTVAPESLWSPWRRPSIVICMRRASALSALLVMLGVPALAAGPTTADVTVNVSVEVVRPCSVATTGSQASVRCGATLPGAVSPDSNAPAPVVDPATSADPHTTVQF